MPKANRICYTCGKEYYYCPSCPDDKRATWHIMWCGEKCKDIFNTLTDESTKKISTEECKEKLIGFMADGHLELKDSVQKHFDRVMGADDSKSEASYVENSSENKGFYTVIGRIVEGELINIPPESNTFYADTNEDTKIYDSEKIADKQGNKRRKKRNSEVDLNDSES